MDNKRQQLGMSLGTANYRLMRRIIFSFIVKLNIRCYRCNQNMTLEDFSIEHKEAWLHTKNPVELYFDIDNISFSHFKCNSDAKRQTKNNTIKHGNSRYDRYGCRCGICCQAKSIRNKQRVR